jgi:hypothetical protein
VPLPDSFIKVYLTTKKNMRVEHTGPCGIFLNSHGSEVGLNRILQRRLVDVDLLFFSNNNHEIFPMIKSRGGHRSRRK